MGNPPAGWQPINQGSNPPAGWAPITAEMSSGTKQPAGYIPYGGSQGDKLDGSASVKAILEASMTPDTGKKIAIYSKTLGIPQNRFGVDQQGNIGFMTDKGGWQLAVPTIGGGSITHPLDLIQRAGAQMGTGVGAAIAPIVGAGAAAVNPLLAPPAAAGADLVRQGIGNVLADKSPMDNLDYKNAGWQAAGTVVSPLLTRGASGAVNSIYGKLTGNNPYGLTARDAAMIRGNMPQYQAAIDQGNIAGISQTPGDITGLRSARLNERLLNRNPGAADIFQSFYNNRNTSEIPDALARATQAAGGNGGLSGGVALKQGAQNVIDGIKDAAKQAGSPYYETAFSSGVQPDVTSTIAKIDSALSTWPKNTPAYRQLQQVRGALTDDIQVPVPNSVNKTVTQTVPQTDMRVLHGAKMYIDELPDTNPDVGASSTLSGQLRDIASSLRDTLVSSSPDYRLGNAAYTKELADLDPVSGVGSPIKYMAMDSVSPEVAAKKLGTLKPGEAAEVQRLFNKYGQGDFFNRGVGSYIDGVSDNAQGLTQQGQMVNVGGKANQSLAGRPSKQAALAELLSGTSDQGSLLQDNILPTLKRVGGTLAEGSPTATDMAAGPFPFASSGARAVGNVIKGLDPFDIPGMIGNALMRSSNSAGAEALANQYTSGDGLALLKGLQRTKMLIPQGAQSMMLPPADVLTQQRLAAWLGGSPPAQAPSDDSNP